MHYSLAFLTLLAFPSPVRSQNVMPGKFELAGRSGVPVMHAALLSTGKVVLLDKLENYTESKLANGRYAYSTIYDPDTHELSPLTVTSNAFCCGGSFLADGTLMTMGGNGPLDFLDDSIKDGFDALRFLYTDGDDTDDTWVQYEGVQLDSKRWYPSAQTLSDGRVFVAAGSLTGLDIRNFRNNNPTFEILDNQASQIFDVDQNRVVRQMPELGGLYRTYPNTGGSAMLPLTKRNNYEAEIMICGGGEIDKPWSMTEDTCGSIRPMSKNPTWKMTKMPGGGRIMVESVLLLDGTILWINGARHGCQGFGTGSDPAFDALIYNPEKDVWANAGRSDIARLYHSVALMLLDGTILVTGSNPNEMPVLDDETVPGDPIRAYATEFRIEKYTPHYLLGDNLKRRPGNVKISQDNLMPGKTITYIEYDLDSMLVPRDVKVLLYHGGFVTHGVHMGQVMVEMEALTPKLKGLTSKTWRVSARIPDIKLAPGPYVIYVVVDGVPGVGKFVSVKTS